MLRRKHFPHFHALFDIVIRVEEDEETLEWEREQLRRGGHDAATATEPTSVKEIYKAAPSIPVIRFIIHLLILV